MTRVFDQFVQQQSQNKKSPYTIKHTELDKEFYDDHYDRTDRMRKQVLSGTEKHEIFPELTQDLFMGLFQAEPILKEKLEINKEHSINHELMELVFASEDYSGLHANTIHDYLYSTLGCEIIQNYALNILEELKKQQEQKNQDDASPNNDDNGNAENDNDLEKFVQQVLDRKNNSIFQNIAEAINHANEEVSTAKEMLSSYGLEEGDSNKRIPMSERIKAFERIRNSRKLKSFAETIGRFREIALQESKHKQKEGVSIESITTGNSLPLVLSSEKARMIHPIAKKDFQRRYLDKQLLQFEVDGAEVLAKGPIIACIDASGSMNGERDKWSRAIAMSLFEIAQIERRNFACIIFDSAVHQIIKIPHNRVNTNDVLDMVELFPGGGTNFEKPLEVALEIMKDNRFHNGDITLISDGESNISDGFIKKLLDQKQSQEFKIRTILIGSHSDSINKISDSVITIEDVLKGEEIARQIFKEIL